MTMRAPLVFLALILLLAAFWVVWAPDEEDDSLKGGGAAQESASEAAGNDGDRAHAEGLLSEHAGAEAVSRDEVRTGHLVQVIDVDGTPARGVQVATLRPSPDTREQFIQDWAGRPDRVVSRKRAPDGLPVTDDEGHVQLESFDACLIYVLEYGRVASLWVDAPEADAPDRIHTLQLQSVPMVEVQVLEADGQTCTLDYRLDARVASESAVAKLPADAVGSELDAAWVVCENQITALADGRRVLILRPSEGDRKQLGESAEPWIYRLDLSGGGLAPQTREFGVGEAGPIQFVLPAFGEVVLHLENAPTGLAPTLLALDTDDPWSGRRASKREEGGGYLFERVETGLRLRTGTTIESSGLNKSYPARTELGEIVGPSLAGERVEHTLLYEYPPGFYGRFVMPEGVDPEVLLTDRTRGSANTFILHEPTGPHQRAGGYARGEVYSDGSFWISSDRLGSSKAPAVTVTGMEYSFIGSRGSTPEEQRRASSTYSLWAAASAAMPSFDEAVDLGEVPLHFGEELLKLVVVNQQGEPVQNARVVLKARVERDRKRGPDSHSQNFERAPGTDEIGEVRIVHRDWFHGFQLQHYYDPKSAGTAIESIRLTVSHPDYLEQTQVISLTDRELRMTLQGSGSIQGTVLAVPGVHEIDVAIVAPGAPYAKKQTPGLGERSARFRGNAQEESSEFKLTSVAAGYWDVVFSLQVKGWQEVFRVRGVRVVAGELNQDPRLQNVDLSNEIEFIRLAFQDEQGHGLTFADRVDFAPNVNLVSPGSATFHAPVWLDDEVVLALPKGEEIDVAVSAEGWMGKHLASVAAGRHEITMRRPVSLRIQIDNFGRVSEGANLVFQHEMQGSIARNEAVDYAAAPEVVVRLDGVGPIGIYWFLLDGDSRKFLGGEILRIEADEAIEGSKFTLSIPDSVFAKIEVG